MEGPTLRTAATTVCAIAIGSFHFAGSIAATSAPDEPAQPIDACALLDESEISDVLRTPVGVGERRDTGTLPDGAYSSTCIWTVQLDEPAKENPAAPFGGKSFVILNAVQWPVGSARARSFLDAFHTASQRGEIPRAPSPREFGDDALWWGDGLAVVRENVAFGLSVFVPSSPSSRPGGREEQLAPRILARLQKSADKRESTGR